MASLTLSAYLWGVATGLGIMGLAWIAYTVVTSR